MNIFWSKLTLTALPIFALACGSAEESSQTKWAHSPSSTSMSIVNARLEYINLNFKRDFPKFSVCIQNATAYWGPELLVETKLAYAAWLDASGKGSEAQWNQFTFKLQYHCGMRDRNYSSVVVIGDEGKISADQEVNKTFRRNQVSCGKIGMSANCATGAMTMGVGGPGSIDYTYTKPNIWSSVSNNAPATVLLSPYVRWTSLKSELSKTSLRDSYLNLVGRADSVSFDDLKTFNKALTTAALKLKGENRLDAIVDDFLNSSASSLKQDYTPVQPGYHVLLHEIGHQFGMDHADNPALDSETGSAGSASQPYAGAQWETIESTMAYADEFLYLTRDDIAGIKHLATQNASYIRAKRGY